MSQGFASSIKLPALLIYLTLPRAPVDSLV